MNPWPIRLAVIGGMAAFALAFVATIFMYEVSCYDDSVPICSPVWRWSVLFAPLAISCAAGWAILKLAERFER